MIDWEQVRERLAAVRPPDGILIDPGSPYKIAKAWEPVIDWEQLRAGHYVGKLAESSDKRTYRVERCRGDRGYGWSVQLHDDPWSAEVIGDEAISQAVVVLNAGIMLDTLHDAKAAAEQFELEARQS